MTAGLLVQFCPFCGARTHGAQKRQSGLWFCPSCRRGWTLPYWRQFVVQPKRTPPASRENGGDQSEE